MISQTIIVLATDLINWPLACAAGLLLLLLSTLVVLVYNWFFNISDALGRAQA
jgi:ABC-type spermidine/putrescine transport system permease subunit I